MARQQPTHRDCPQSNCSVHSNPLRHLSYNRSVRYYFLTKMREGLREGGWLAHAPLASSGSGSEYGCTPSNSSALQLCSLTRLPSGGTRSLETFKKVRANLGLHPLPQIFQIADQGERWCHSVLPGQIHGNGLAIKSLWVHDSWVPTEYQVEPPWYQIHTCVCLRPELVAEQAEFYEQGEDRKVIPWRLPQCTLLPPTLSTALWHLRVLTIIGQHE